MSKPTNLDPASTRIIELEAKLDRALGLTDKDGKPINGKTILFGRAADGRWVPDDDSENVDGGSLAKKVAVTAGVAAAGTGALALRGQRALMGAENPARVADGTYARPGFKASLAKGASMTADDVKSMLTRARQVVAGNSAAAAEATGQAIRQTLNKSRNSVARLLLGGARLVRA